MRRLPRKPPVLYYCYILCLPNGKPFYIGKGQGKRVLQHEIEAEKGCHCPKCEVIRKVWRSGKQIQRYIVFTSYREREALAYEGELLALYGIDTLTNQAAVMTLYRPEHAENRKRLEQQEDAHYAMFADLLDGPDELTDEIIRQRMKDITASERQENVPDNLALSTEA